MKNPFRRKGREKEREQDQLKEKVDAVKWRLQALLDKTVHVAVKGKEDG